MEITRESVFISAVRAFFKTFGVLLGIAVGIVVIVLGISAVSNTVNLPDKSQLTIRPDAEWNQKLLGESSPVILQIDVTGVIGTSDMKASKFKQMLVDSRSGVLANNRVKGILLYVNSPGGAAVDSSAIFHMLKDYKEKFKIPVYAFVEGLCASGSMYISAAADKIYATPDSTIGSIGVRLGPTFNVSEAMKKVGIESLTLTEGKNKDALNPFRPWKEGEDAALKAVIAGDYEQFVSDVTTARPSLKKEELIKDYGANVFIATKAVELGYIDEVTTSYDSTLKELVAASGIGEEKYQVLLIEPYQSVLRELAESKSQILHGKLHHVFPTGTFTNSEMSGQILYLYQP